MTGGLVVTTVAIRREITSPRRKNIWSTRYLDVSTARHQMNQSSLPSTLPVQVRATPETLPAVPPWMAEATLMTGWFWKSSLVEQFKNNLLIPRGRMGRFTPVDFLLTVLLYGISGEHTLKRFYKVIDPWRAILAGFWCRETLPSRSALSRFLADVPPGAVATIRSLFFSRF